MLLTEANGQSTRTWAEWSSVKLIECYKLNEKYAWGGQRMVTRLYVQLDLIT